MSNAVHSVERYPTLRKFDSLVACVEQTKREWRQIWVTHVPEEMPVEVDPMTERLQRFGTTAAARAPMKSSVQNKVALVLGSESAGISAEMLRAADYAVHFPINGRVESLNIVVSGALILHELHKNYSVDYEKVHGYTGVLRWARVGQEGVPKASTKIHVP